MFLRVMFWVSGIGVVYCVVMVTLTYLPGVSLLDGALIAPAGLAAALCILVNFKLVDSHR